MDSCNARQSVKSHVLEVKNPLITPLINSSSTGQNGRHFADDSLRCISVNENVCILIKISLRFVPDGPIDNSPALV